VTKRSGGFTGPPESPAFRVWLPSWRCQLLCPREPVSVPHAPGLHSSGLSSGFVADPRFLRNPPLLRFVAKPFGLAPALQRLQLTKPAVPPAFPPFSGGNGGHALLSFGTSQVSSTGPLKKHLPSSCPSRSFIPDLRRSQEPEPQGIPSGGSAFPLFRRVPPAWCSRPTASATLLERGSVAAYFFGSETRKLSRVISVSS
jgi:hypothetical protein